MLLAALLILALVAGCREGAEFVCPDGTAAGSASECAGGSEGAAAGDAGAGEYPEETKEADKAELFKNSKAKSTGSGATLSIDEYTVEDKGDWAKITYVKATVLNEGYTAILPTIYVMVWDDSAASNHGTKATLSSHDKIEVGGYMVLESEVNIVFRDVELEKTIGLMLVDGQSWEAEALTSVEHRFKVK